MTTFSSFRNLYPKFASPWASAPCRPQDIDFHVPSEYLTNIHIRDKLAAIKLSRYGEDLLFYLYYMNGGDLLQLLAAVELFNRDWRYHKEERVWITRAPGMEPTLKTNAYERGTYYFFDCLNWRKVAKEFHLEYEKLEEGPTCHPPSTTAQLSKPSERLPSLVLSPPWDPRPEFWSLALVPHSRQTDRPTDSECRCGWLRHHCFYSSTTV
ncbi:CCR4-NOT transcription complex subunit 2-like, partial [Oncorhynchus nerka]|uniref:CCR4-NOT transcription complex subunit 2-like n=1 Tax=Oncorhynchus nerka TaxID=8023 RepID=UPI0031B7EE3D